MGRASARGLHSLPKPNPNPNPEAESLAESKVSGCEVTGARIEAETKARLDRRTQEGEMRPFRRISFLRRSTEEEPLGYEFL